MHGNLEKEIEEIRKENNALRETMSHYQALVDMAPDVIFELSPVDGRILSLNPAFEKITGWSKDQWIGQPFSQIIEKSDLETATRRFQEVTSGKTTPPFELRVMVKSGAALTGEFVGVPGFRGDEVVKVLGFARNISEQKNLENQLVQKQKMEAIGTMAGGIAHDFNNFLMTIMMNTEFAFKKVQGNDLVRDSLDLSLKAACRARDLVEQILTFSRKGEKELYPLSIYPIIKESLKMLRSVLPTTVEIEQKLEAISGMAMANPTQIQQVLINLCSNAASAMRENGGTLTVSLMSMTIDSGNRPYHPDILIGNSYFKLSISDTGCGMTSDIVERIYEPFFSTKKTGEGTGMGLAVVHGIIKGMNGAIIVKSTPKKGTVFDVYLPRIDVEETSETEILFPDPVGSGKLLVIDDEEFLVKSLQSALRYFGYKVVGETCGIQALEVFKQNPDQFDLVITDETMPKMTGTQLAKELIKVRPDIPIVLCTGFSEEITEEVAKKVGIRKFVMKPISTAELAEIIDSILNTQPE